MQFSFALVAMLATAPLALATFRTQLSCTGNQRNNRAARSTNDYYNDDATVSACNAYHNRGNCDDCTITHKNAAAICRSADKLIDDDKFAAYCKKAGATQCD